MICKALRVFENYLQKAFEDCNFNIKDSLENTENDEMLLEILKETFSEIDLKKIVEFYNTL